MSASSERLAASAGAQPFRGAVATAGSMAGLPLLVAVIHTNASDVAMRSFGAPSLLQPLAVLLAVAVVVARRELRAAAVLQPVTLALAAWTGMVALSTLWARDLAAADGRAIETAKGFASFLLIATLAASWRSLRAAFVALAASASLLSLLTFAQTVSGGAVEFSGFARGQVSNLYGDVTQLRASGPVGDPNFYAQMLLFVLPIALFAGVSSRRIAHRAAWFAAAAMTFGAALLTYSRGAMVAILLMAALTMAAVRMRARHALAVTAGAAVIAVVLVATPLETARRLRTVESLLTGSSVEHDSSIAKRKLLLTSSWRMFEEHPMLGVGAGNFARHFPAVRNEVGFGSTLYESRGDRHYPHNLYVEIAAEQGLAGTGVFATAIFVAFAGLRSARHRLLDSGDTAGAALAAGVAIALAGYLASSLFLHGAFQRYLWMLFGFAAAVVRLAPRPRSVMTGRP